jgi:hypothetical protein
LGFGDGQRREVAKVCQVRRVKPKLERTDLVEEGGEGEAMRETQSELTRIQTIRTREIKLGDVSGREDVVHRQVLCRSLKGGREVEVKHPKGSLSGVLTTWT